MKEVMTNSKLWNSMGWFTMVFVLLGQSLTGYNFWIGQGAFMLANVIAVCRVFILGYDLSDKTKQVMYLGSNIATVIIKLNV